MSRLEELEALHVKVTADIRELLDAARELCARRDPMASARLARAVERLDPTPTRQPPKPCPCPPVLAMVPWVPAKHCWQHGTGRCANRGA